MRSRGFEHVVLEHRKTPEAPTRLPYRGSSHSAGYDFESKENVTIMPYESHVFWSDVKAYMLPDEVLKLYIRSSLGLKGLRITNQTGIIDSDYYSNPKNDGNIGICLQNHSDEPILIFFGDRIAQGIFQKYLVTDDDESVAERVGGFGSSGK